MCAWGGRHCAVISYPRADATSARSLGPRRSDKVAQMSDPAREEVVSPPAVTILTHAFVVASRSGRSPLVGSRSVGSPPTTLPPQPDQRTGCCAVGDQTHVHWRLRMRRGRCPTRWRSRPRMRVAGGAAGRRSAAAGGSLCGHSRACRSAFGAARAGDAARAADRPRRRPWWSMAAIRARPPRAHGSLRRALRTSGPRRGFRAVESPRSTSVRFMCVFVAVGPNGPCA